MVQKLKQKLGLFKTVWEKSWTVGYAYTQGLGAALMASIAGLSSFLSSSQFKDVLDTLTVPWYVPTGIAILAVFTWLAHGREDDAE